MKRITIFILLILGFSATVFALPVNECKTDIYFGNGVWNKQFSRDNCIEDDAAECSQKKLKQLIQRDIIKNNPALQTKYGEVKLQYNWGSTAMIDVLETYYQLKREGQVNDLEFFMVMMIITGGNVELSTYATGAMLESMPFVAEAEQDNVNVMLKKYYEESLQYSHRVLLVSHSQGNLFANRVYDSINPSDYQNYFANVQVASPANRVHASHGTYITGWVDPVINPIPGSMESNADLDGFGGHAFVAAYLDSTDTYTKIVNAIKAQLGVLDTIDSQWITDKELERGTCDYRITVKHRFDPALEIGEKVYPFAPNKKLYQVNGAYVKATCGGTDFTDDWADKKENECWMINNPPEEKIVKSESRKLYIYALCRVETIVSSFTSGNYRSTSGMYCSSGVVTNLNEYLERDEFDTRQLDPVVPQGTDYLVEAILIFTPLYTEATEYVEKKFNEYKGKYPIYDATFYKRGFEIECRDPKDGHYYHIGAGCFAEPSLVLDNIYN